MNPCRKTVETTVLPVVGRTVVRTHGPPIAGIPAGSDTGLTMMTGTLAAAMTTMVGATTSAMRIAETAIVTTEITVNTATTRTDVTIIVGIVATITTVITVCVIDLLITALTMITTNHDTWLPASVDYHIQREQAIAYYSPVFPWNYPGKSMPSLGKSILLTPSPGKSNPTSLLVILMCSTLGKLMYGLVML